MISRLVGRIEICDQPREDCCWKGYKEFLHPSPRVYNGLHPVVSVSLPAFASDQQHASPDNFLIHWMWGHKLCLQRWVWWQVIYFLEIEIKIFKLVCFKVVEQQWRELSHSILVSEQNRNYTLEPRGQSMRIILQTGKTLQEYARHSKLKSRFMKYATQGGKRQKYSR